MGVLLVKIFFFVQVHYTSFSLVGDGGNFITLLKTFIIWFRQWRKIKYFFISLCYYNVVVCCIKLVWEGICVNFWVYWYFQVMSKLLWRLENLVLLTTHYKAFHLLPQPMWLHFEIMEKFSKVKVENITSLEKYFSLIVLTFHFHPEK